MVDRAFSEKLYTVQEFLEFVNTESKKNPNVRYELIDGYIYVMSSPTVTHQRLVKFVSDIFSSYFKGKTCEVFLSPLDVYLFDERKFLFFTAKLKKDCTNVIQPDLFVVCDKSKIKEKGIDGAPDLVIEVVSKSTANNDYIYKLNNYMRYGVKEYWIVNYKLGQILVYLNENNEVTVKTYRFDDIVKSNIFDKLYVDFSLFAAEHSQNEDE